MKDKYYYPELKEFHEGFEYERWHSIAYTEENWVKETLSLYEYDENGNKKGYSKSFQDAILMFCDGCDDFRVKYLDKTDIESLGFEESFDEPREWYHSYKGNSEIQLYFNDKTENKELGIGISIYNDILVFSGYIKNKSKLKMILKMINV